MEGWALRPHADPEIKARKGKGTDWPGIYSEFAMERDLHSLSLIPEPVLFSLLLEYSTGWSHGSFHLSSILLVELGKQNLLKDEGGKGRFGSHFPKRMCHPGLRRAVKRLALVSIILGFTL